MTPFETQFVLTKDYLAESFDESLPHSKTSSPNFLFPAALFIVGFGLLVFSDQPGIAGWSFVALCVLELLHIKFRRGWWLFRQTWGKNNELEINLTIDEKSIRTHSPAAESEVLWSDLDQVIETDRGVILVTQTGHQQYLSKSLLPEEWLAKLLDAVA